ncbi:MAG TPA: cob(I)yrinic acid a,c-diamide adenosyltransferase, partial [Candidatus Paceibacterota bacterium]
MLYTGKGDNGTSGLFGACERFSKDDPVFEALGMIDELNSLLGVCFAKAGGDVADALRRVQEDLFVVQAQLAGADKKIEIVRVERLEKEIAEIETALTPPTSFVIAGATELSALLDYARAVARRAERSVVRAHSSAATPELLKYLNRLSSLLYALA